jgi:phage-related protein
VYTIDYYSEDVQESVDNLPTTVRARYAQFVVRMKEYGSNLGEPHTKAMGEGLFELRIKGGEGIAPRLLLHPCRETHCDVAQLSQKDTENTCPRPEHGSQTHEGDKRCRKKEPRQA